MANATIYLGSTSNVVPEGDVSYWQSRGWTTSPSSGSPGSPTSQTQFKEGSAYKFPESNKVYVFNNGKLEWIPSEEAFISMYGGKPQQNLNYTTIQQNTVGGTQISDTTTSFKGKNIPVPANSATPASSGKRQIYRIGVDIYNATTNQKIGATDWANNWSGKSDVQEIAAPASAPSAPPASPSSGSVPTGAASTPTTTQSFDNHSLVKFPGAPTVYLVDNDAKTLTPFESEVAFTTWATSNGIDVNAAWGAIQEITPEDTRIVGFQNSNSVIKSDGKVPATSQNAGDISARYGQANNESSNYKSYLALEGFINVLKGDSRSGIDPMTIDNLLKDKLFVGGLMSALSYGGYTLSDVYREIKRKDMVAKGDLTFSTSVIDPRQTKDVYAATTAGKTVLEDSRLAIPTTLKGITDMSLFDLKIFQMPETLFKELVPITDVDSPEFQAKLDEMKSAYHDVAMQQVEARTEQEKAVADENYRNLQETAKRNFGITLSNNAIAAWDQIEALGATQAGRGVENTGIANKELDKYLRSVRRSDQINRTSQLTADEANKASYYRASATSEQIAALTPEERQKWGLAPSSDVASKLDVNYLMNTYGLTKEKAQEYRDSVLDENGNYRSATYATKAKDISDIESEKKSVLQTKLLAQTDEAEKAAYYDVTNATGSQLSSYVPTGATIASPFEDAQKAAEESAKALGETNVNTTPTTQIKTPSDESSMVTIKDKNTGLTLSMTKGSYETNYKKLGNWSLA